MATYSAGVSAALANGRAELARIDRSGVAVPLVIAEPARRNVYVCSPQANYVDYARYELGVLEQPWLRATLRPLIGGLGRVLRAAEADRAVFVNNWLLSTNLYASGWESLRPRDLRELHAELRSRWPRHAIVYRSLNRRTNPRLMRALASAGAMLMPARQVYLFDGPAGTFRGRSNVRADLRLLARDDYEIVGHDGCRDLGRVGELYAALYLEKYTPLNPRYTARFFAGVSEHRWIDLQGLRAKNGRLDGVVGVFEVDGVLSAPIVGYDTTLPRSRALYRRLMAMVLRRALVEGKVLNLSSGAAHFKRLRGGEAELEYIAVDVRHLPRSRRLAWRALAEVARRVGGPILEANEL